MAATPTIGFSIPNMITVTLMVLIVFAVVGFLVRLVRGRGSAVNDGNPDAGGGGMPVPEASAGQ